MCDDGKCSKIKSKLCCCKAPNGLHAAELSTSWFIVLNAVMLESQSSLTKGALVILHFTLKLYHLALPADEEPMKLEDCMAFDLWLVEQGSAELEAKLAAMKSAQSLESSDPQSAEEQPESFGAAAQPDTASLLQLRLALSIASPPVCTLDNDTDTACDIVVPAGAFHNKVCLDLKPGTPAVLPGIDCHSLSLGQLDQQLPQQQQQGCSNSEHRSAQRKLASMFSRFFPRLGGTPKTEQVLLPHKASPVMDNSSALTDSQFQHSVSSPRDNVALTADASVQHSPQPGIEPSTAVTSTVGNLLSQEAFPVAAAQHPVYSCTSPNLLWQTSGEIARAVSAISVTDVPQLPRESSPGPQKVPEERAESVGVQPTFALNAQEQHVDPPSNRYRSEQVFSSAFPHLPGSHA